jgi:hypothetical protein
MSVDFDEMARTLVFETVNESMLFERFNVEYHEGKNREDIAIALKHNATRRKLDVDNLALVLKTIFKERGS